MIVKQKRNKLRNEQCIHIYDSWSHRRKWDYLGGNMWIKTLQISKTESCEIPRPRTNEKKERKKKNAMKKNQGPATRQWEIQEG